MPDSKSPNAKQCGARVLAMALLTLAGCHAPSPTPDASPHERTAPDSPRVAALFEAMAADEYAERGFPDLWWEDIPALLARADATRPLRDFPRNPLSSQYEEECPEGMVALWLIEGIREGVRWPSLSALCFHGRAGGSDWTALSAANQPALREVYMSWWARVRDLPPSEAAAIDPLEGTGFHWH